ncbi:Protein of unknown function, partial [Gryllus bimaculatus]
MRLVLAALRGRGVGDAWAASSAGATGRGRHPPAVAARLVLALRSHFSTDCVFLARAPGPVDLEASWHLRTLAAALAVAESAGAGAVAGVPWASASLRPAALAALTRLRCRRNRPLLVVAPDASGRLLRALQKKPKTQLVPTRESTGGAPLGGGNWSGLIGVLLQRQAGAALNRITLTTARQEAAAFTVPILTT